MVDLFHLDMTEAMVQFLNWYQMACCLKEHTEQSLIVMENLMEMYIPNLYIQFYWFLLIIFINTNNKLSTISSRCLELCIGWWAPSNKCFLLGKSLNSNW
jgi:hypothetical protein